MDTSTIAAIATPPGYGGIGIIKISGPDAVAIATAIFRRSHPPAFDATRQGSHSDVCVDSHRFYHGYIVDSAGDNRVLDEVLLVAMFAPSSYTREDVVEIHAHSGLAALQSILEMVLKHGARMASPGEFTKRAFLNGRIDLAQAEAVVDIIQAKTKKSLEMAADQMRGGLSRCVSDISSALLTILSNIDAGIDFPDEMEGANESAAIRDGLIQDVLEPLTSLVRRYEQGHVFRDGLKLVIVGKPNVGKSSLMNRLLQKERVIVTSEPGTTRDVIEETLNIHGIPVIMMDTAGLHDTDDPIETKGIEKTHESVDRADLVLFMVEAGIPLSEADQSIYERIKNKKHIVVVNKIDRVSASQEMSLPGNWRDPAAVKVSAIYDMGISDLKSLIARRATGDRGLHFQCSAVPNLRHKAALDSALAAVQAAIAATNEQAPMELVAIDVKEALASLGDIVGETTTEDLLDHIFDRFCIGK